MNPASKRTGALLICADALLTLLLILACGVIAAGAPLHFIRKHPEVLVLLVLFPYSLYLGNLYKVRRRRPPIRYLGRAVVMTLLAMTVFHLFHSMTANYQGLEGMSLSLSLSMAVGASFVRGVLLPVMAPPSSVAALVIGGRDGRPALDAIRRNPWSGIRAVGIIDDDPAMKNYVYRDIPVLGGSGQLEEIVRRHDVGIIVDASPAGEGGEALPLLPADLRHSVKLFDLPAFYEGMTGQVLLQRTTQGCRIEGGEARISPDRRIMAFKRSFDVLFSSLALLLALPLFAAAAVLLRASSPESVLKRTELIGKGGKPFFRLSFRNGDGSWRERERFGARFLSLTRLSELPVLINILKGEMSFCGPLPVTPTDMDTMKRQNSLWGLRLQVRPGVFGWAEVNLCGRGSALDQDEKLGYDLYYVRKASGRLDFSILANLWRLALFHT